ncbi:hypothetical protein MBANPS3_000067 [Mucor bainieri]
MEKILDYTKYNYLISFGADGSDSTFISGSSNRAISPSRLLYVNDFIKTTESPPFKHHSTFLEYFELLSKERGRLLEDQRARLASIRDAFKRIKEELLKENEVSLETAQILFVMPLGWAEEHYKDKLQAFFLDVGWISPRDNKSKLVMIPFLQVLVEYFQRKQKKYLDRERISVLFFMQQIHGEDEVEFSCTFFNMQSAKELIAVSKTLACGEFLLVPSIVNSASINLASVESVMYSAVKRIIAHIQGKDPKYATSKITAKEDDPVWTIACEVSYIQENMLEWGHHALENYFFDVNFENHQLQDLGNWTCGQLITAIYEDVNVKQYFKQVCDFFKEALAEYGAVKDSPNGIQHILLCSFNISRIADPGFCIHYALAEEDIIEPGNNVPSFHPEDYAELAMQQSYKMIQVANAILPPVIVGNEEQNDSTLPSCKPADSLIAPNSFYVQASVTETQISFILNKVIEVPSSETGIDLFTVQERSVEVEHIEETALHILWNHYQAMIDMEKQQHALLERCQGHKYMVLSSIQYYDEFKKNAKRLIDSWLTTEDDTFAEEGLDAYQLISVDQQCTCALKLSRRLLLEVGLKPAIANIVTTITSALFSDDFFGLYPLSALIIEKNWKTIKNLPFLNAINGFLEQALERLLQMYHSRLLLLDQDKCTKSNISQYLGRGDYSQVSSINYIFRFGMGFDESILGLLEGGTCKRLPVEPNRSSSSFELTYSVLAKGDDLPLDGINLTFLQRNCNDLKIDVYLLDNSKGRGNHHQVGNMVLYLNYAAQSSVSIKILPMHHSSALKFVAASIIGGNYPRFAEDAITVLERTSLKKKLP